MISLPVTVCGGSHPISDLKKLEEHSNFDPRVKISAIAKDTNQEEVKMSEKKESDKPEKVKEDNSDNIEGALSLFNSAEAEAAKPKEPGWSMLNVGIHLLAEY